MERYEFELEILHKSTFDIAFVEQIFEALSQSSKYPFLPAGLPRSVVKKINALREIIHEEQSEVSNDKQSNSIKAEKEFFDVFPDFSASNEGLKRACEVTEYLTAEELLLLYGYFLENDISLKSQILMLAKKYLDKTGMNETLAIVKKYGGPKGFAALLCLVGTPYLDSEWLVEYLEACI